MPFVILGMFVMCMWNVVVANAGDRARIPQIVKNYKDKSCDGELPLCV